MPPLSLLNQCLMVDRRMSRMDRLTNVDQEYGIFIHTYIPVYTHEVGFSPIESALIFM